MKHQKSSHVIAMDGKPVIEVTYPESKVCVVDGFSHILRKVHGILNRLEFSSAHDLTIIPISSLEGGFVITCR